VHRNRPIPPRIIKLVTPVRNKRQLNAKLPRRSIKAPRLIPQLPRKNQNSFLLCSHRKKKGEYLIVIASEETVAQASFSGLRLFAAAPQ
jgi:hypothetical protein